MTDPSTSTSQTTTDTSRPSHVSFIAVLDIALLGIMPLLSIFAILAVPYSRVSNLFIWLTPGELSVMGQCGIVGFGISPIATILVGVAALNAWRGSDIGRAALIFFAIIISFIQPVALSAARYYSLINHGTFDQDQFLLTTRILLSAIVVVLNLGCFFSPRANAFYKAHSKH